MNEDRKFCEFCGKPLLGVAKYCANCGNFLPSGYESTGEDVFPAGFTDEIASKISDLIFPVTGKKILAGSVLFLVFILLVGMVVASNPAPTGPITPTPSIVPTASVSQPAGERDDKATKLEEMLVKQGMTVVTPFTKRVNKDGNDEYIGTFKDDKYGYNVTIVVCKSSNDSASLFNKQVKQLKAKNFSTYNNMESADQWIGYNAKLKQSVEVKQFTGSDKTLYLSTMFAKKL